MRWAKSAWKAGRQRLTGARGSKASVAGCSRYQPSSWRMRVPLRPQAMALAGDHLLLAGPPDIPHPRDALASLEGRQGGALWILSTADGRKTAEWKLDAPPVYDGLAIADGRLYWSGTDGRIRCWAEGSE